MKRKIIQIDEDKCTGCGLCIPNCPEGAIQIIDGKARLISDLLCDGLGACLGNCPEDAITIEEREAEPYNEAQVMANVVKQGENVVKAHLLHLKEHNETEFLQQALDYLKKNDIDISLANIEAPVQKAKHFGCPGAKMQKFPNTPKSNAEGYRVSQLSHWPLQMHLISPQASYFQKAEVLIAADCVAYAVGDFHKDYLQGKSLAIACPKLDSNQESYVEKVTALIDQAQINTITVMIMQVPCCQGLLHIARQGANNATRKVPIKLIVVGIQGNILQEEWIST